MAYDEEALEIYRDMVAERHLIWQRRQVGEPPPWTENPILSKLKMTNMYRVLDPGSQFVFELNDDEPIDVIARLVFYRVTNLPSTWRAIKDALGCYPAAGDFIHKNANLFQMLDEYRQAGNRVFSGAYIIIPEPGTANDKVGGALRLTRHFVTEKAEAFIRAESQREKFEILQSTPGLGRFLSMQILTDWNYLQPEEPDLSFVVAGPGARRGAAILCANVPAEDVIADLTTEWQHDPDVRLVGRGLTTMDVQNTMCEWSKYARELVKVRKKTTYKPAHPGTQPSPVVPAWW